MDRQVVRIAGLGEWLDARHLPSLLAHHHEKVPPRRPDVQQPRPRSGDVAGESLIALDLRSSPSVVVLRVVPADLLGRRPRIQITEAAPAALHRRPLDVVDHQAVVAQAEQRLGFGGAAEVAGDGFRHGSAGLDRRRRASSQVVAAGLAPLGGSILAAVPPVPPSRPVGVAPGHRLDLAIHALAQLPDEITLEAQRGRARSSRRSRCSRAPTASRIGCASARGARPAAGRRRSSPRELATSRRPLPRGEGRVLATLESSSSERAEVHTMAELVGALHEPDGRRAALRECDDVLAGQRVVIVTNRPTHYRVPLFNRLSRRLAERGRLAVHPVHERPERQAVDASRGDGVRADRPRHARRQGWACRRSRSTSSAGSDRSGPRCSSPAACRPPSADGWPISRTAAGFRSACGAERSIPAGPPRAPSVAGSGSGSCAERRSGSPTAPGAASTCASSCPASRPSTGVTRRRFRQLGLAPGLPPRPSRCSRWAARCRSSDSTCSSPRSSV